MTPEPTTIRLADLNFGHARKDSINSRRADREVDIEALADNIAAEGLLYPLIVTKRAGKTLVAAGNRRLAALRLLAERGAMNDDTPVNCVVVPYDEAKRLSLVENFHRRQLHPVDQYRAFAELDMEPDEIAKRFGMPIRTVRQVMALGGIHHAILDDFRDGKVLAEAVREFTLTSDKAHQLEVYKRLKKNNTLSRYAVRANVLKSELAVVTTSSGKFAFVTLDEYIDAGGRVKEDLFSDETIIVDNELLNDLVNQKRRELIEIIAQCGAALTQDLAEADHGWYARRLRDPDLPPIDSLDNFDEYRARAEAIRDALRNYEDIEQLHILVDIRSYDISVYPTRPPAPADEDAPDDDDTALNDPPAQSPEPEPEPKSDADTISAALSGLMHDALSVALARVVARHPTKALTLLVAAMHTRYGSPLRVKLDGHQAIDVSGKPEMPGWNFLVNVAQFDALEMDDLLAELAICAAASIDVSDAAQHREGVRSSAIQCLIDALPHDELVAELSELMPAREYLRGCTKTRLLAVMREALAMGSEHPVENIGWSGSSEPEHIETLIRNNGYASAKKEVLVDATTAICEATGWLPPQYRQSTQKEA